jgi:arylsulfatase A-like enzyme
MTAGRLIMEQHHLVPEPTWWVFTSDHGEMLGDHCLFRKTFAYEGSARTPLIVTPPRQKGGRTCRAPVLQEDLMPTMLDIAGAPIPSAVEGRSLLPLIADAPGPVAWREFAHGEHSACYAPDHGMQYLTDGLEKYVWYTQTGQEQLFDLADDPQESHDLAAVSGAHSRLERWRGRMVEELAPRSEDGLSDGRRLISGRSLPAVRPALLQ